ncbi:MAG: hypothetical protein B7Z70_14435 [Acidithiobacillus ferrivorans]|uniref:Uncharacterized protein n=1 Tax=Acidithiobacillus ferrivorans TaxID=160808 RepID=A0A257SHS0_9PROT|nr:MAG: hypothetical protein B7Z70_14435 [Acidithiobacillus ferrivorans]
MDDGKPRWGLGISVPEYMAETSDFRPGEHAALFLLLLYAQKHGLVPDDNMADWLLARSRLELFFEQGGGYWKPASLDWIRRTRDDES